jgi:hypothetical protein
MASLDVPPKAIARFVLENVRNEGIEAYRLAVFAQQFDLFRPHGPSCLSVNADVRFVCRNRDAIELAKAHLPGLTYAAPADHHRGTQRADERGIVLVCPHCVHSVDVTYDDRGNKLPIGSLNAFKIVGPLSLRHGCRTEQQPDEDEGMESSHGTLLRNRETSAPLDQLRSSPHDCNHAVRGSRDGSGSPGRQRRHMRSAGVPVL